MIGMPAVGKSTVGVLLAKRMGYGFVDAMVACGALQPDAVAERLMTAVENTASFAPLI